LGSGLLDCELGIADIGFLTTDYVPARLALRSRTRPPRLASRMAGVVAGVGLSQIKYLKKE